MVSINLNGKHIFMSIKGSVQKLCMKFDLSEVLAFWLVFLMTFQNFRNVSFLDPPLNNQFNFIVLGNSEFESFFEILEILLIFFDLFQKLF
jgi:hypothetical protein